MVCVDPLWDTECMLCHRPVRVTCRRRPIGPIMVECGICCQTEEESLNWLHEVNVHLDLWEFVRWLEVEE